MTFPTSEDLVGEEEVQEDKEVEETAAWEWESVTEEAGNPVIIQVVLVDPSMSCSRCAAEPEVPEPRADESDCPEQGRRGTPTDLQAAKAAQTAPSASLCSEALADAHKGFQDTSERWVAAQPEIWDLEARSYEQAEVWDLEACQAEQQTALDRPASSEAGSEEGRTRGWRHLLTPLSSPFSLACSEDTSKEASASAEPESEVDCAGASSSDKMIIEPLQAGTYGDKATPRSVHSMETGIGFGSSDATHHDGRSLLTPLTRTSQASQSGVTPLHVAAQMGSTAVVQTLLESGAAVDAITCDGFTPLHGAANMGCADTVASLISARADLSSTAADGSTALHGAARNGHVATVALLLENGSALDVCDQAGGFTPLHDAVHAGQLSMVQLLLRSRANPAPLASGTTPLDLAVHGAHLEIVQALLVARAWPTADGAQQMLSPLRLAAHGNHTQILRLLLSHLRQSHIDCQEWLACFSTSGAQ